MLASDSIRAKANIQLPHSNVGFHNEFIQKAAAANRESCAVFDLIYLVPKSSSMSILFSAQRN
jgi:hypothetical protein